MNDNVSSETGPVTPENLAAISDQPLQVVLIIADTTKRLKKAGIKVNHTVSGLKKLSGIKIPSRPQDAHDVPARITTKSVKNAQNPQKSKSIQPHPSRKIYDPHNEFCPLVPTRS